jgi:hypothetical protein
VALKYGYTIFMEIAVYIPVIFPDTANILTSLKQPGGIFLRWELSSTVPDIE